MRNETQEDNALTTHKNSHVHVPSDKPEDLTDINSTQPHKFTAELHGEGRLDTESQHLQAPDTRHFSDQKEAHLVRMQPRQGPSNMIEEGKEMLSPKRGHGSGNKINRSLDSSINNGSAAYQVVDLG